MIYLIDRYNLQNFQWGYTLYKRVCVVALYLKLYGLYIGFYSFSIEKKWVMWNRIIQTIIYLFNLKTTINQFCFQILFTYFTNHINFITEFHITVIKIENDYKKEKKDRQQCQKISLNYKAREVGSGIVLYEKDYRKVQKKDKKIMQ